MNGKMEKNEINFKGELAKIFRRMINREDFPQMALVEMSEKEFKTIFKDE